MHRSGILSSQPGARPISSRVCFIPFPTRCATPLKRAARVWQPSVTFAQAVSASRDGSPPDTPRHRRRRHRQPAIAHHLARSETASTVSVTFRFPPPPGTESRFDAHRPRHRSSSPTLGGDFADRSLLPNASTWWRIEIQRRKYRRMRCPLHRSRLLRAISLRLGIVSSFASDCACFRLCQLVEQPRKASATHWYSDSTSSIIRHA